MMYCATASSPRERVPRNENALRSESSQPTASDCIVGSVKALAKDGRFAERIVTGLDDAGRPEQVVLWIERRPGAVWAVGRMVNPQLRSTEAPRDDDYLWQGYELGDCLEAANAALEDDVVVSEEDGGASANVKPFHREELLRPLERFFFGRR